MGKRRKGEWRVEKMDITEDKKLHVAAKDNGKLMEDEENVKRKRVTERLRGSERKRVTEKERVTVGEMVN